MCCTRTGWGSQRWISLVLPWLAACGGAGLDPCFPGVSPDGAPALPGPQGYAAFGHAHNDYEHGHPLDDALDARFYSVEVDVWFAAGQFVVGHWPWQPKGQLAPLYLDPLQHRVNATGSVHGDGEPFVVWLDLKHDAPHLVASLRQLLQRYPMLGIHQPGNELSGPVTLVLTGDKAAKTRMLDGWQGARAVRDSNTITASDAPADTSWTHYAINFTQLSNWSGNGEPDVTTQQRVACAVNHAHTLNRRIRFFDAPDTSAAWTLQLNAGADWVHTDDLDGLSAFLEGR